MRKIYRVPSSRDGRKAVAVAIVLSVLVLLGIAWHPRTTQQMAVAAQPPAAIVPAPTAYFPSQYELHAGPPEPLPDQF
ncbi:MAG TPA: hypothetical protein VGI14_00825 [Casimicrobiaceae bacterium]|jgi:hypothetical protein